MPKSLFCRGGEYCRTVFVFLYVCLSLGFWILLEYFWYYRTVCLWPEVEYCRTVSWWHNEYLCSTCALEVFVCFLYFYLCVFVFVYVERGWILQDSVLVGRWVSSTCALEVFRHVCPTIPAEMPGWREMSLYEISSYTYFYVRNSIDVSWGRYFNRTPL